MIFGNITTFTRVYQDDGGLDTPNKLLRPAKKGRRANKRPSVVFRDTNIAYIGKTLAGQEMAALPQNSCPNASIQHQNHSFLSALHITND